MPSKSKSKKKNRKKSDAVYVAKSKIHGRGLFAARKIPAETVIIEVEHQRVDHDGMHVIWEKQKKGWQAYEVKNEARFVNHADSPNAAFFGDQLWSLRPIKKGEEITHDYTGGLGET